MSQYAPEFVSGPADGGTTSDVAAPVSNTAATVTYNAVSGARNTIGGIAWSYSAVPTGGNLQVSDGANVIFSIDITAAGPGFIPFFCPKKGSVNTAMTITLAAGGAGVSGKVSILGYWTEHP